MKTVKKKNDRTSYLCVDQPNGWKPQVQRATSGSVLTEECEDEADVPPDELHRLLLHVCVCVCVCVRWADEALVKVAASTLGGDAARRLSK